MNFWTRIALLLGLASSAGLWWLFWHVGIHDRLVGAGDNWFENWGEPSLALTIWSVILVVLWETTKRWLKLP